MTVALTLGRAVPYASLTSNGNSTSGSRPSPPPTTASNSWTFMPPHSSYVQGWTTTLGCGWRPNPSADQTVNVPYDIGGHRLE